MILNLESLAQRSVMIEVLWRWLLFVVFLHQFSSGYRRNAGPFYRPVVHRAGRGAGMISADATRLGSSHRRPTS